MALGRYLKRSVQNPKESKYWRRLPLFVSASIALHAVLLPLVLWVFFKPPDLPPRRNVKFVSLRGHATAGNEQPKREEVKKPERQEKKPEPIKGQVVELPPSVDEEAPEKADYLASTNHKTKKETKARNQTLSDLPAGYERTIADPKATKERSPAPDQLAKIADNKPSQQNENQTEPLVPRRSAQDRLAFKTSEDALFNLNRKKQDEQPGVDQPLEIDLAKQLLGSAATTRGLVPSMGTLARIDSAPFADHLKDVEEGDATMLNTVEFKHAGFFNRVKRTVARHWRPIPELQRRDPTGSMYSNRDRFTQVLVHLDSDGIVKSVQVLQPSGLDFLDREAEEAFKQAFRFPNPPQALLDPDTQLMSFKFGFVVTRAPSGLF